MKDTNKPASDSDLERLAARLAMLASGDGEADNAGRAVGAMARRIGLSGGDLKRIFLAGVASLSETTGKDRLERERELAALRQSVMSLDADARRFAWERDVLRVENGELRASLNRRRNRLRSAGLAVAGGAVVASFVTATAWLGQSQPAASPWIAQDAPGPRRAATVRTGGAQLFGQPERVGQPLTSLPHGAHVQVRRLVWKSLFQWAEVEAPGGWTGYVLTTEIELP